jgi:hypothetical protein
MRTLRFLALLALLGIGGSFAGASKLTCANSANVPNAGVLAFNFDLQVATSSGGGGGGAGKPSSTLTVQIPFLADFGPIYQLVSTGRTSSSCTLTASSGTAIHVEYIMNNVTFSEMKLLQGDYFTNNTPGPIVELTLAYSSIAVNTTP